MVSFLVYISILTTAISKAATRNYTHPITTPELTLNINNHDATDPEMWMNTTEIIKYQDYPVEEHVITTEDGYILEVHRIPHGKKNYRNTKQYPVILQHGILASSAGWVLNTPENNLAYKLADSGYDVWLANSRGNSYGKNHKHLSTRSSEFWHFSFHEMGKYDVPATIDYILNITNSKQVHYIGYSMGAMILFVTLTTRPEYNTKIRSALLMGPASSLHHIFTPLIYSRYLAPIFHLCEDCELAPFFPLLRIMLARGTQSCLSLGDHEQCLTGTKLTAGFTDPATTNLSRVPVYNTHFPDTTSVRNLLHCLQLKDKPLQMYDYGACKNFQIYGQANPPEYNFNRVRIPIALFWSESDPVITILDVTILITKLKSLVLDYKIPAEKFSHGDYLESMLVGRVLYDKMLETLDDQETNDM